MAGRKRREMSGLFDFLKKKKPVEERGLSVPLPKASIFDAFRPPEESRLPAVRPEATTLPALPPPKRLPGILRIFEMFAPPLPPSQLPAVSEEPRAPAVWEQMFGPPAPVEEPPVMAMFPVPFPEVALPAEMPITPFAAPPPAERQAPKYTFIRIPRLPSGAGGWTFPFPGQLAIHFRQHFMLDEIFRWLAEVRGTEEWSQSIVERAMSGAPIVLRVDPVVHQNLYTDFAKLFNIPWEVVESYIGQARTDEELKVATDRFIKEIMNPLLNTLSESFELLKPRDFPGWFSVQYDQEKGTWYLYYTEAMLTPFQQQRLLPPGVPYQGGQVG